MSQDFALWESQNPLEDDEAGEIYASLIKNGRSERGQPSANIAMILHEINARWPEPAPGYEDESPCLRPS